MIHQGEQLILILIYDSISTMEAGSGNQIILEVVYMYVLGMFYNICTQYMHMHSNLFIQMRPS
jgi:hypothetical protein